MLVLLSVLLLVFTNGRITLLISLSLYFSNSLVIDLTARSLTTVSSWAHKFSKIGKTAVCCPPRAGPTLASYSVIANTTSSSYFLIRSIYLHVYYFTGRARVSFWWCQGSSRKGQWAVCGCYWLLWLHHRFTSPTWTDREDSRFTWFLI